jgi:hypothetical protein
MSLPTNDRLPCTCTPDLSPCPGCTQWRRSQLTRPGTRSTGKALALSAPEIRSHLREAVHARTRALQAWQLGGGTYAAYRRAREEVDRWQRRLRRLQASLTQQDKGR